MKDIIITGLQSWDIDIGSNCKDIAQEFSKKHRVLFVNRAYDRKTVLKEKLGQIKKSKRGQLIKLSSSFWVYTPKMVFGSINWLKSDSAYDFIADKNGKAWAKEIAGVVDHLEMKEPMLFIDNDFLRGGFYAKHYPYKNLIYYIRDNLLTQSYFQRHGKRLEKRIMEMADFVFANSAYLADYAKKYTQKSYYIGQGFDKDIFLDLPEKSDLLEHIQSPIIGYIGNITAERVDIALLEKVASENPKWNFVFVGPEDDRFKESSLHQLNNVFFKGKVPPEEVPMYIKACDVCINPQVINEMTQGNYPRKIDEYLAVGKPVVAIKTLAMAPFEEYVYLADSYQDFSKKIAQALIENNEILENNRKLFANAHTWENSVSKIYEQVEID
ncbi:glycosyltransferase [Flexithrix dorotheae]|uniref:glycosyltransferase n=1 Tax=Flexithrix dorotheae TaxID=70993 RepID=UPI00037D240C|nr:glycosyltransferase [Flexithrix dorotheae]